MKQKPTNDKLKGIGVEITEGVRKRLKVYVAAHDLKIKAVVNAALDEYLKKKNA